MNKFKDTTVYGNFQNKDNYKSGGNIANASFDRSIIVGSTGFFKNGLGVTGDVNVIGNIKGNTGYFNNGLGITGDVNIIGNIKGNTGYFNNGLGVTGNLGITGNTNQYGNIGLTGNLSVSGSITLPNQSITDGYLSNNVCLLNGTQTLINKTLTSAKLTTPLVTSGGIGVTGNSLFNNDVTISNNLTVGLTGAFNGTIKLPNTQIINTTSPLLVDLSSIQTLTNKTLTDCISNTQLTSDNSTKIATTAFVKSLGYSTNSSSINDTQLSSNIPRLNGTNTFTNTNNFNGTMNLTSAYTYFGSGETPSGNSNTFYDSTNVYGTQLSQNSTSYLIQNNYNSGSIVLRNKNTSSVNVDYTFSHNGVTIPTLLTCSNGLTVSSGLTLYNNAILDSYLSSNVPLKNTSNTYTNSNIFTEIWSQSGTYQTRLKTETNGVFYITNYDNTSASARRIDFQTYDFQATPVLQTICRMNSSGLTMASGNIVLSSTSIINQSGGTGQNVFNTMKFNNSTTNKQITFYENSSTNLITNYTISIEPSTLRYNVANGGVHIFSVASSSSTYSNILTINSSGLTLLANANINQSGTGIISQSGTGNNLMKNITMNADNNILQSGIGVIQQNGTGTNALKGSTFSASNTHYNGSSIIQYDSTNAVYTSLSQATTNSYLIENNYNSSSIYLRNKNSTGGSVNYIFSYDAMTIPTPLTINNNLIIPDYNLVLKNGTNQTNIFQFTNGLYFWNLNNSGTISHRVKNSVGTDVDVITINSTSTTINNNLICNSGINVSSGSVSFPNGSISDSALSSVIVKTNASNTFSSTNTFNSNVYMNSSLIAFYIALTSNLQLQNNYTSYPLDSPSYLGYTQNGTIYTTLFTLNSGSSYNLGTVSLPSGVWNIIGIGGVQNTHITAIPIVTFNFSISSTSATIDNSCCIIDTASYNKNVNFIKQVSRILTNTSTGSVNYYLVIKITSTGGTIDYNASSSAYTNLYATRIG